MEVHGRQPDPLKPERDRLDQVRESTQDRVESSRENLNGIDELRAAKRDAEARRPDATPASQDRLELSSAAQTAGNDLERQHRIEKLRAAYIRGELGTPERIERAADGILRG